MRTTESVLIDGRQRRRRHSDEFKAQAVAECARPGVSIAAIALHHGINANLLRRWLVQAGGVGDERASDTRRSSTALEAFVPVAIAGHDEVQPPAIVVEIKRGPMQVKVSWPMTVSVECGAWLRELMR